MSDARVKEIVWRPDAAIVEAANLTAFIRACGLDSLDDLDARAEAEPEWFWDAIIRYIGIRFDTPYSRIMDTSAGIPWTKWCVGGHTNAVLSCLDRHAETPVTLAREAVVWEGEDGHTRTWTYAELITETACLAEGMRDLGLGPGDVIAIYMPMVPEIVAAYLAIVKIGGIVLPLFSGFGAGAVAGRLNEGGARAVLTVDGTNRRGKAVAMKPVLDEAAAGTPVLEHIIVLDSIGLELSMVEGRDHDWRMLTKGRAERSETTIVGADDPMMLIFTSGTTGRAKGTVHSHCGFPTKVALDLGLCLDFKPEDRMLWMSDMGWLVGPILVVGVTLLGGTLVLAEGAPDYPQKGRIWRLIEDFGVTFLGIAPTIVRNFMRYGTAEIETRDLSSLRVVASTGEPWNPDSWLWLFEHVCGGRVPILNYSGGTEIGGGIVTSTMIHPLKPCSLAGPIPGMAADVVDAQGRTVPRGAVGELVMRQPSIGLTRGLWHDPDNYLDSYWSNIPGLWVHGDFASIDEDGFWYIHGRSDDTIKIAGKRTGPAEIESLLLDGGRVVEAAVIGVPDKIKGQAVVCVCVPAADEQRNQALAKSLSQSVVRSLGAPFRPKRVVFADDLPKTRNMKIMRRVVRAAYLGEEPGDLSSLVNPESYKALKARFG